MVKADLVKMASSSRITIVAAFQAADEMRRFQRIAYRMRQLQVSALSWPVESSTAVGVWRRCYWPKSSNFTLMIG
jgi:hypothetical protein